MPLKEDDNGKKKDKTKTIKSIRCDGKSDARVRVTCAMRWCCRLMTLETAICMLPNTATTSSFLSSKDGAPKFWRCRQRNLNRFV